MSTRGWGGARRITSNPRCHSDVTSSAFLNKILNWELVVAETQEGSESRPVWGREGRAGRQDCGAAVGSTVWWAQPRQGGGLQGLLVWGSRRPPRGGTCARPGCDLGLTASLFLHPFPSLRTLPRVCYQESPCSERPQVPAEGSGTRGDVHRMQKD